MTNDLPDWSNATYQPDVALSGSPIAYVNGSVSATIEIPSGVHVLSIVCPTPGNIGLIHIGGVATTTLYFQCYPNQQTYTFVYYAFVQQTLDPSVSVLIEAFGTGEVYLAGVLAPVAVETVRNTAAIWEAPNTSPQAIEFTNPGAGNTATIIPAQADFRSIWLLDMWWMWDTAVAGLAGTFGDGAFTTVAADVAVTAGMPRHMCYRGARLEGGDPFVFHQTGSAAAGAATCYGSVTFSSF